jgi:hypothetical protein
MLAFDMGGGGAYERVLHTDDQVTDQLTAAAGTGIDSLVRSWRTHVMSARTEANMMTPGIAMVALFWTTTLGALALRSSRWR